MIHEKDANVPSTIAVKYADVIALEALRRRMKDARYCSQVPSHHV